MLQRLDHVQDVIPANRGSMFKFTHGHVQTVALTHNAVIMMVVDLVSLHPTACKPCLLSV